MASKNKFFGKEGWWRFYFVITVLWLFVAFYVLSNAIQSWGELDLIRKILIFIPFFVMAQMTNALTSVFLQEETSITCVRVNTWAIVVNLIIYSYYFLAGLAFIWALVWTVFLLKKTLVF